MMSTYYDFMAEAMYDGHWYNIDFHTQNIDASMRHQYLATFSRNYIGLLRDLVDNAWIIRFDDLAESTQKILLNATSKDCENRLRREQFYVAGSLADFEKAVNGPFQMEYYVTRNQIAAYEEHKIEEIFDYLTAHELLELPQAARQEYVLYRWNASFDNTENINAMITRLKYQVECFNEAIPYHSNQFFMDCSASKVRVIYRIS